MPARRILTLNYEFPPIGGGAGRAHLRQVEQYAGREDLVVDVLTSSPSPSPRVTEESLAPNVRIVKVGVNKKHLQHWRKIEVLQWLRRAKPVYRRMLHEGNYDLVHAYFAFPTGWLCYRTRKSVPYLLSLRGSDVPGANVRLAKEYKLLAGLFRRIWRGAAGIVANSAGLRERAHRFLSDVDIEVIPNGVDTALFHPPADARLGDEGRLRLLSVGRLSASKRTEWVIQALGLVRRQFPAATLTLVGGGGMEDQLRQVIAQEGLADCVEMRGIVPTERMPEVYRECDLFVSASLQEGMSNAWLEAMASGLPVVTTRCEGVEELIDDNGVVVDSPSAEALAEAVCRLAGDRGAYDAMRLAARRRAERFGWGEVAEQYLACYERLLRGGENVEC